MQLSSTKLQLAMARKAFNNSELAEAARVSRQTVSYILHGKDCRPDVAARLAAGLSVDVKDLMESGA